MKRVMDVIHNALFGVAWDRRGGVATFLAATIIPLVAFTGLAVDTARGYLMKSRLNYALDAAALAGGREMADEAKRDAAIDKFFKANFPDGYMGATIDGPIIDADPVEKTIQLSATANMGTSLMRVLGIQTMEVAASTEVKLSSRNIEVSVVLDITGSMSGTKIVDLKAAAADLVDIVVQDQQTPHYSKVALVPYSMGVNVGAYADAIRGPVGSFKAITGATKTNPVVITAPNHGFANGDKVFIAGVQGMTQVNSMWDSYDNRYTVDAVTTNTFALKSSGGGSNINGTGFSTYTSGGTVSLVCSSPGCEYYRFTSDGGTTRIHQASTCVTERIGANAYTDVAPSTAYVGLNYPNYPVSTSNLNDSSDAVHRHPCVASTIVPLSSDKTMLTNHINAMSIGGSTAGHIGIAWGWYMLSPNFAYIWPDDDQKPADYGEPELLKVAVIMTDGAFNTIYANGVIAQNSGSGSGNSNYKINMNGSNNKTSFEQAELLCDAMKADPNKIEIYTIGFAVQEIANATDRQNAIDVLAGCATDASHAYLAADGDELKTVFKTIAMNISRLRLSK
jgi:Flp pilus assembly protein TadG